MSYTNGPWTVVYTDPDGMQVLAGDGNTLICDFFGNNEDASIIAAAPDTLHELRLLETAARRFAEGHETSPNELLKRCENARATIAKARGE